MTDYHVKACENGIMAGVLKKDGEFGKQFTNATEEAFIAVRDWLLYNMADGETRRGVQWQCNNGKVVTLMLTISDAEAGNAEGATENGE